MNQPDKWFIDFHGDWDLEHHPSPAVRLIHDVSERCECAAWLMEIEHLAWSAVVLRGDQEGFVTFTPHDAARLRSYAVESGVWWAWDDEQGRPRPVELTHWLAIDGLVRALRWASPRWDRTDAGGVP